MDVIGIVCEYNPFHNGHKYQIDKIKKLYPDSIIIAVMSSNFCERGEVSVINKWDKTSIAIDNGVNLVIELPFVFSSQSADIFSFGALKILNYLKVKKIVFGSESNDISLLKDIASLQVNNKEFDSLVKEEIDSGVNYPTALSNVIKRKLGKSVNSPNDLLAISYIKEIIKNNYDIEAISIKRTNDYHSTDCNSDIISATAIRNLIKEDKNISKYIPWDINSYKIYKPGMFKLLKYKINIGRDLNNIIDVSEGIDSRIIKYINISNSYDELINHVKTKRYTYNKLNRMFIHILTDLTCDDVKDIDINYIRVLGMNNTGSKYLKSISKSCSVPIITRYKNNDYKELLIEQRVNNIYSIIVNDDSLIKKEIGKPIIR